MLSCIFGKCSSETYVVNKVTKQNGVNNKTIISRPTLRNIDQTELETQIYNDTQNTETKIIQNGQLPNNTNDVQPPNNTLSDPLQIVEPQTVKAKKNENNTNEVVSNIEHLTQNASRPTNTVSTDEVTGSVKTKSSKLYENKTAEQTTVSKENQNKQRAPQPPHQILDEDEVRSKSGFVSTEIEANTTGGVTVESKNQKRKNDDTSATKELEDWDSGIVTPGKRRSGIIPLPVNYNEAHSKLKIYPKKPDEAALIKEAIERNDFLNKIINGKRLEDVVNAMYSKDVPAKTNIVKQGDKGTHMFISVKGKFQVLVKSKVVSEFSDIRVFGELAILYNAKRLATVKALTACKVWALDYQVYQQITVRHNIKSQDEIMEFLMNNEKLKVVGKEALQEVANLLKSEFFKPGTQIVRQGDKGNTFYIIRAGTVTITKDGEGVVGLYKKGDCFGELALLKEDCRQATVTADAPGVECLTLTRKEFVDHFGELKDWEYISIRPKDSFRDGVTEHEDIDLRDLKMIKTLGVGGFGRVELVQHKKTSDLVFALKYLKKIDILMQHQQEHVYNEKNIQMACKSPFIVRLYRTYKDNKYIYLLMESCLGGDLWSLLQKQKVRRFEEKEARFIAGCVLEAFEYLHSRGIIYRDLKPENLLIAANGYIKLTDFGFAKKISSRGKTYTFAGTPEYVAPEIVLNRGHDRAVDYWAFGAFIFELLTGRTPFRTDDSSHMKTYNKILSGIDTVQFPSYVNLKARHIVEKLCRPVPSERLGMQRGGIKDIKMHKWFLGFDWQKFAKCEMTPPFKPKLRSPIDTQYFDQFKKDTDVPPDEISGWDSQF